MSKTLEEILQSTSSEEILEWIKEDKSHLTREAMNHFDKVRAKEFKEAIIRRYGSYDPNIHYDFNERRE